MKETTDCFTFRFKHSKSILISSWEDVSRGDIDWIAWELDANSKFQINQLYA